MQVKKFEAPTIQEALATIKRELGPEAVILQTRKYKRGFGLLSRESVEVTAAVSDRSLQKKIVAEHRLPDPAREDIGKLPADRQADYYDQSMDKHLERLEKAANNGDRVEVGNGRKAARPMERRRYVDIPDEPAPGTRSRGAAAKPTVSQPTRSASPAVSRAASQAEASAPPAGRGALAARYTGGEVSEELGFDATSEKPQDRSYVARLEEELSGLWKKIEELSAEKGDPKVLDELGIFSGVQAMFREGALSSPAMKDAFEQLVLGGLERRQALALTRKAAFELGPEASQDPEQVLEQVAAELMGGVRVRSFFADLGPLKSVSSSPEEAIQARTGPRSFVFVGPTGGGKTTTVAKIAGDALLRRRLKVGLINLEEREAAAFDALSTYAKLLNVPFRRAASMDDLQAALLDFKSLDLVLIDTAGCSHRDGNALQKLKRMLEVVPDAKVELVLPATMRDAEAHDMAQRLSVFNPDGIVISKLDEAVVYGSVYNIHNRMKIPLLYFTTGQRIPEDIEEATPERVAALILDI